MKNINDLMKEIAKIFIKGIELQMKTGKKFEQLDIKKDFRSPKHNKVERKASQIRFIVLHYPAVPGISAKKLASRFAATEKDKSTHYCVDEEQIFEVVDPKFAAWHCGIKEGGTYKHPTARNKNAIGIDLCEDKICCDSFGVNEHDWYFTEKTLELAADLVAALMKRYNIPISNVIRHNDVTGKFCPAPFVGKILSSVTHNTREKDFALFLGRVKEHLERIPE